MIEQPLGWDDIYSHAQLQTQLETPICLDECIHDVEHARAAIEIERLQNHQHQARPRRRPHRRRERIHDLCQAQGDPGVVRRHARIRHRPRAQHRHVHRSRISLCPATFRPASATGTEDIIEPEVEVTPQGTIVVPTGPGIGYTPRLDRIE